MPANFRKLLQERALKGVAGFDEARQIIGCCPVPSASEKPLDKDDADYGDDAVVVSDGGSEQENEEGSAPASK
jgi:hypothetical protein